MTNELRLHQIKISNLFQIFQIQHFYNQIQIFRRRQNYFRINNFTFSSQIMSDDITNNMNDFNINQKNDDVLSSNVILKRNENKNKNKNIIKKFVRQFLDVISNKVKKANAIINQIIINIYQLIDDVDLLKKKHNLTINNLNQIKASMIIKDNFNVMITKNDIVKIIQDNFNNNDNIESSKSFVNIQKNIKKITSNSISSHLFQSIFQIYFNSYEFSHDQTFATKKTIENFRLFNTFAHQ